MEKTKYYISGQITGLKPEEYEPLFYTAEDQLKAKGYEVINPLRIAKGIAPELIDPKTHTEREIWRTIVKADITELMKCEAIYMLQNWERSEGATLEHDIAKGLYLAIDYEQEPRHRDIKEAIEAAMGVPFRVIAIDSRNRWHVYARMIYAHHCKKDGDNTQQIASETKHDESSIGYYLRHYDTEYKFNRDFRKAAEKVATMLSKKLSTAEPK
jgi:hypothetical protein